ncbi:MAG: ATP-binding protein [Candidatus Aminicenantes bacterium]|jgi:signal transduction histidine kinase
MKKKKSDRINPHNHTRDSFKDFRTLSHKIMFLALRGLLRIDFLHEASRILLDFSGCNSVGLWLEERDKYYRSEVTRSRKQPFHLEIMTTRQNEEGKTIPDTQKNSTLEQLCINILLGHYDPDLPFFTKNGSFWTANTEKSLASQSKKDSESWAGKIARDGDYRSLALIPISVANENIGLLQLKSVSPGFFSEKDVEFYEGIVQTLGIALTHRRAQVEVRERVKELTCLYGIAKLAEQPEFSIQEILQGIVELLPPAWLYTDIASARIIVDGNSYSTPFFREKGQKQSADIVVAGEHRGVVEVIYREKKPELDEGPFLREERSLIDTIAREVALIIERKQTEQDKTRLQEQLRHADRLATIGQLSAGVAHELNEPLGSILGFAQLAQKQPRLSNQVKGDIEKIMKASLHAREVVKKLMLFARQMPPQKTRVSLNQIVEEGFYFLESRCEKEGIKVVRQLSDGIPEITADPAQLTQVLVNLVVNALQAMPKGGKLTVKTEVSDDHVKLSIKDTGVGMSDKALKQIFLPFYTTKNVGQGTGLGLPVVHGIVTSHGGTIHVESKEGFGATFEIKLPVRGPHDKKGRS